MVSAVRQLLRLFALAHAVLGSGGGEGASGGAGSTPFEEGLPAHTLHEPDLTAAWMSDGHRRETQANDWNSVETCTCESPCDLNTATFQDMERLFKPLRLHKHHGVPGDIYAFNLIVNARPICNPLELATTKKIWVEPEWLPKTPRPDPGYLLIMLWGCGGNQGLAGTLGGRGGCCPVTASSVYCGLKKLFGTKQLNHNMHTKTLPSATCYGADEDPYTSANPPPWCYVNDKYINYDEFEHVVLELGDAVSTLEREGRIKGDMGPPSKATGRRGTWPPNVTNVIPSDVLNPRTYEINIPDPTLNMGYVPRRDTFYMGASDPRGRSPGMPQRLSYYQDANPRSFELDKDMGWWTEHLKRAFMRFDRDGDYHISENEYLQAMGMTKLRGLPRAAYVRQPWERTRASSHTSQELQKCIMHHGALKCVGKHPVTPALMDVDLNAEDRKANPDCITFYGETAYENVEMGEVCCAQSTWEWQDADGKWHPLRRSECVIDGNGNCKEDLSDTRDGGAGMSTTSRRRAWQRVRSVSEKLQDTFVRMKSAPATHPVCGRSCIERECNALGKGPCLQDPFCSWNPLPQQTARPASMPHPHLSSFVHVCRSVFDLHLVLDRDRANYHLPGSVKPTHVRIDLRPFSEMLGAPFAGIDRTFKDFGTTQYSANDRATWPRWWREIAYYLGETTPKVAKSEPSNRTATRPECIGALGLLYFVTSDSNGQPTTTLSPAPTDEKGSVEWGGIHRIRQQQWYPRWVKKRNQIRH
eukprot:g8079.t1